MFHYCYTLVALLVIILDISVTESWSLVEVEGEVPPPRTSASIAAVDDNLYLFGGLSQARGWMSSVFIFNTGTQ